MKQTFKAAVVAILNFATFAFLTALFYWVLCNLPFLALFIFGAFVLCWCIYTIKKGMQSPDSD